MADIISRTSASSDYRHHRYSSDDDDSAAFSSDAISLSRRGLNAVTSDEFLLDPFSSSKRSSNLKGNSRVQELTINKLRFGDVKFVGREAESEVLHSRLQRMITTADASSEEAPGPAHNKELILIRGYSGCGKSTLASQLKDWSSDIENGLFVQGKFEITTKTPFSGVCQAFTAICNKLKGLMGPENLESRRASAMKIGDKLTSDLGSELHSIISLIPELSSILPSDYEEQISERCVAEDTFEAAQGQWKNVFRVLTRAFGTCCSHLVVILDDLQWADMASLLVIESLLTDKQNPSPLMIVGCYRSNEVDDAHVLSRMISSLSEKTEKGSFKLTEMELENVSVDGVNKMIMALLGMDDENTTKELSHVCFNRTLGNPFFVIQFMTMLDAEGLISFNLGLLKWVWDVQLVEQSTMSTKNVVDLLVARMKKLPNHIQLILQYAANLGASFNEKLIQQIWSLHSSNTDSNREVDEDLQSMFDILQKGHYIEKSRGGGYSWVHDKVQEAGLTLGKASDPDFQFEIGTILYNNLDEDGLERALFDVVNLINKGRAQRLVLFSQLNLRAARKARNLSAFDIAARYCSHGIVLLQDEKWSVMHRELTLSLMVLGCEMELASHNIAGMEIYAREVLARDDCTTLEKVPVYLAMANKYSSIDMQYQKALDLYLSVLRDLGCSFPRNKLVMAGKGFRDVMNITRKSRKSKVDYAQSLPLTTDERQKAIMALLNLVGVAAYFLENPAVLIYSIAQSYHMAIRHGVCEDSGIAFSGLGVMILAAMKDYEVAVRFVNCAIEMQRRVPSRYNEAAVLYNAAFGVLTWAKPLKQCDNLMSETYSLAIKSGNISYAMLALSWKIAYFPIQQGKPLPGTLSEASRAIEIMEEYNQNDQAMSSRLWCQVMGNLAGQSDDPLLLRGKWFDTVGWFPPTPLIEGNLKFQRLVLLVFFGHYGTAADLALEIGHNSYEKLLPGFSLCQFEAFMRGVALFAMARKTKKRKYRRAAEQILCTIDDWVKKGNPNVQQYSCLLKAERAASKQRHVEAESLYKEAIVISARTGQLHAAGLANQRYADYLLVDRHDEEEARYRIEQAIRFYSEWGADAVVERVRNEMAKP